MVKNSFVMKRWTVLMDTHCSLAITMRSFYPSRDIYIYLELTCHDKQNGGQRFNLHARIADLWRLKAQKVDKLEEDDRLAIFKPGL